MTVLATEAKAGVQEARARAAARARRTAREAPSKVPSRYAGQAREVGQNARIAPGGRGYQPVLLAEFLAAVVIVALVPVAAGGSAAAKVKGSPSPYDTGDLKQLAAVGVLYFILALASSGNSGRVSAWFGGLVLIGLAMAKLSHGQLQEVFRTVSGQSAQEEQGSPPA